MPDFHLSFAFDGNLTNIFTIKFILDQLVGGARDLDLANRAVTFHASSRIDYVSPDRIEILPASDHAADHRAGAQSDADLDRMFAAQVIPLPDTVQHIHDRPGTEAG